MLISELISTDQKDTNHDIINTKKL